MSSTPNSSGADLINEVEERSWDWRRNFIVDNDLSLAPVEIRIITSDLGRLPLEDLFRAFEVIQKCEPSYEFVIDENEGMEINLEQFQDKTLRQLRRFLDRVLPVIAKKRRLALEAAMPAAKRVCLPRPSKHQHQHQQQQTKRQQQRSHRPSKQPPSKLQQGRPEKTKVDSDTSSGETESGSSESSCSSDQEMM